jgi:hypothetical protein
LDVNMVPRFSWDWHYDILKLLQMDANLDSLEAKLNPWVGTCLTSWFFKSWALLFNSFVILRTRSQIYGSHPTGLLCFIGPWTLNPCLKWPLGYMSRRVSMFTSLFLNPLLKEPKTGSWELIFEVSWLTFVGLMAISRWGWHPPE